MRQHAVIGTLLALSASLPAKAQGDLCTGATVVSCGGTYTGNTALYTADVAPVCTTTDGTGGGVWYRFGGTGLNTTASLCGSAYDTKIRVYTGSCAAPTCVVGNDDFCGLQSQVTWLATTATVYYILVHGFGAATGAYTLNIICAAPAVPMCYSMTATPYLADPYAGTPVALTDDWHSAVVPIGFSFCYNGTTYTSCVISSNNYVSFNPAVANTYSPWPTVVVPAITPTQIANSILNPWQDIHPGLCPAPGCIYYQTLGVAPNRRFVVSYLNVPMFSCTQQLYSSQTVLYEGTNCIGSYILSKQICSTWNGGNAVHALHNNAGTSAAVVAGRNNTQWTASAQGMFFVPTCAPCSTSTTASCLQTILPIELLHFRGRAEGVVNVLEWATASEQNSASFIIERSADGEWFEAILHQVAAGQSNVPLHYSAIDTDPLPGANYYRMQQIDMDGATRTSDVIVVNSVAGGSVSLSPNPSNGTTDYRIPQGVVLPTWLVVRDLSGRIVHRILAGAPTGTIDLPRIGAGTYMVSVGDLPGSPATRLVVEGDVLR